MRNLDNNLNKLMDYIVKFNNYNGYMPSVREMAKEINIKSTSTIYYYLNILEQKSLIKKSEKNHARAFEIVKEKPVYDSKKTSALGMTNIPLVGTITAGIPILATENVDGEFSFPNGMFNGEELFMLNVSGESMINAGILDGDIIIVRKQSNAENGEIVVAMIDDSATVKRFFKEDGRYRLQPENPTMQPIYCNEIEILGKVIGLVRKIR